MDTERGIGPPGTMQRRAYQSRAATPLLQTAAEVAREVSHWAVERWKSIDPYLKHDCVLYDDNHRPTGKFGQLSPDSTACIYEGLRVPIGPHFWHDKADTLLCYDQALKDCFAIRADKHLAWEPIHPMLVNSDCFSAFKTAGSQATAGVSMLAGVEEQAACDQARLGLHGRAREKAYALRGNGLLVPIADQYREHCLGLSCRRPTHDAV